jgi:Flp pilus assembly protein TadD
LMSSGPRSAVGGFSTGVPVWTWLLNQTQMIAHYLRLVFWPRSLVVFYGWPLSVTLADVLPYALLVAALLVATAVALVRWPMLGFPGAWFFLTLAPTSSIIPIATEVGAERRMYLPLLAISVLVVLAITALWGKLAGSLNVPARRHTIAGVAALVVIAGPMVVATMARNREYESALTLARTVVARRPSAVTRHYLAEQLSLAGLHDEAIPHLREAVAAGDSRAGFLLGIELFNAGKFDDAVRQLTAFVRTSKLPYRLVPHWLEPPLSEVVTARLVLARTAAMQRRWPDTVEQAKLVLDAVPGNREAQLFLADGLFGEQQYAAAAAEYQKYLTARPNDGHALTNLGITYIVAGNLDDAIASFRRAVAAEPKNPDWHRLLGMAMMDRGDSEGAAAEAREGLRLKPGDAALGELLARATAAGKPRP